MTLVTLVALLPLPSWGLTLSLESEETPATGITIRQYRTSSPSADVWVALVDLCTDGIYVDARRADDSLVTAGTYGADRGVALATNGDFYRTGPLRVYGDAVGDGVPWPLNQTGLDPAYSGEWYYDHYGWIAFGHDTVTFTHTEWTKNNVSGLVDGYEPTTVRPDFPPGTIALVSGFPELVVEGAQVTCTTPTAGDCFPDRTDMRDRNPRTAMGLTADHGTFLLVVVDGRTAESSGMYGSELADLMFQLGAYEAFNLDGGGSTEMWTPGDSYLNNVSGNNLGSGTRSIANHWGVFAGLAPERPARPGHCETAVPCGTVPALGGIVDDTSTCFRTFGPQDFWRDEAVGEGGSLHWTNATEDDLPANWAWWRLDLDEAGRYDVQVKIDPVFGVFADTHYQVRADGVDTELRVDQGLASGWVSLGEFTFAAGADQWVAVYDDTATSPGTDPHITADAVQLVRLDPPVTTVPGTGTGDTGTDPGTTDTDPGTDGIPGDTAEDGPPDEPGPVPVGEDGCGCATSSPGGWTAVVGLLALVRRRSRWVSIGS